jgi:hypothetical protein
MVLRSSSARAAWSTEQHIQLARSTECLNNALLLGYAQLLYKHHKYIRQFVALHVHGCSWLQLAAAYTWLSSGSWRNPAAAIKATVVLCSDPSRTAHAHTVGWSPVGLAVSTSTGSTIISRQSRQSNAVQLFVIDTDYTDPGHQCFYRVAVCTPVHAICTAFHTVCRMQCAFLCCYTWVLGGRLCLSTSHHSMLLVRAALRC